MVTENRLVRDRFPQHVEIDQTVSLYREVSHAVAELFEFLAGVEHRFVFGGGRNDVIAFFGIHFGDAFDRQVVRFGGSAGEDDFARSRTDEIGDLFARFFHCLFGNPAEFVVAAGGVPEVFGEIRQHCVKNPRVHPRRRVIVEINRRLHFFLFASAIDRDAFRQVPDSAARARASEAQSEIRQDR